MVSDQIAMKDIPNDARQPPVIKVMGSGGCGINAINRMIENGIQGAEFIALSVDTQELVRSKTERRLHLASARKIPPAIGLSALMLTISEDERAHIKTMISGADIVFIVAGMGSSTGTSIAPIAAKIARDMNILTIAVVSMPFLYEGNRTRRADQGIQELSEHADALIVIPNSMLITKADMRVSAVFNAANDLMRLAVSGIAKSISANNLISLDIADLRMIFADAGMVMMGTGLASGQSRAGAACEQTIARLFPVSMNLKDASGVLINITASPDSLKLKEVAEIMQCAESRAPQALVIAAAINDEAMGDDLRVTLFATGLTSPIEEFTCQRGA